ncbi:MAG: hypothetical protein ACKPKO_23550, partial [Candidatus Fonsibacter sp.]
DMNVALALKSDKTYVDTQLAQKANQSTTYTKTEVDTELAKKVNQTDWEANCYTKSQTDTKLDAKQNLITTSSTLALSTLVAQTNVITLVSRTTNIEFSDVASSGATALSIKSRASTIMTMSPTVGIKHFTYTDFYNNYVYNIKEINGIYNILGSGIFSAARGSYNYFQVSGGTYIRPTAPTTKGIYLGQTSTTSYGIEITAPDDTTIDFSTPGIHYKGRIQYNKTTNALRSFFTNSSATASLVLTDST